MMVFLISERRTIISFAHNFNVTFTRMFWPAAGKLLYILLLYKKVR